VTLPSARLQRLAEAVPRGHCVADIGCDHGLLAIALVKIGRSPRAIGVDLREEPLAGARVAVERAGLSKSVELRLGDGFQVIGEDEIETAVIAGMGAKSCCAILRAGVPASVERLVLQVNWRHELLRSTLAELGWKIVDEAIDPGDDRYFITVVAERSTDPVELSPLELEFGPRLLAEGSALFIEWLDREITRAETIADGLAPDNEEAPARKLRRRLRDLQRARSRALATESA
jgi:tRNA (adenine22-N1)-methyltransferase